jgi:Flp pilus assembly protein TadG
MSVRLNIARRTTDSRTPRRSRSARSPLLSASDAVGLTALGERLRGRLVRRWQSARGTALMETALTLPLLLLVSVGIFEFGRAYQTWQILTNAAREGARVAVLPNSTVADVQSRVTSYMQSGQLPDYASATISVDQNQTISIGGTNASASLVTVQYPFSFIVLNPVAQLVSRGSSLGAPLTLTASAEMRNEVP